MSRIGITFEEVKKAIAELQGRQKNPTVDAIREILGTGSKSTIARFLREWKAKQGLSSHSDGRLPSDLLGMINGLWDALQKKADEQISQYRQESSSKMTEVQQQLINIKQIEASLRQTIHSLEEQLHQQKKEAQRLKVKLMTEEQEKIKAAERFAALNIHLQEHREENKRLHQFLKHMQENLEHYQAATQKLREDQSLLIEKQQNEHEERLSLSQRQIIAVSNEKSAYQVQYNHLKKVHESLVKEHKALTTQHAEIQAQQTSLKMMCDSIQHDQSILKKQNQDQATELTTIKHTVAELQLNIKSKDETIALLENKVAKANDKIETLRHESQFALQEKANLEGQLKQIQTVLPFYNGQVLAEA